MTVVAGSRTPGGRIASPAVAWLLAGLVVVLLAGYAVLATATHELTFGSNFWNNVLIIVPITAIGLLVAARQPVLLATQVLKFHGTVAVAASTLVAAALFNPLRRRVQRIVDRRFNRTRYDADRMVAAFAARLQDAVDLDSARDDLTAVVRQALEPAHVSVWIRPRD